MTVTVDLLQQRWEEAMASMRKYEKLADDAREQVDKAPADQKMVFREHLVTLEHRLVKLEERLATLEQERLMLMQQQAGPLGVQHPVLEGWRKPRLLPWAIPHQKKWGDACRQR